MTFVPPYPVVKLPDCQQNWDALRKKFIGGVVGADIAPGAVILDTQRMLGASAAYASFGNGTNVTTNAAQTILLGLNFTPEVDCWWETHMNVGLIQKMDAAWNYVGLYSQLNTSDVDGVSQTLTYMSDHNALPFISLHGHGLWKLAAGTAYQVYGQFQVSGGTWTYYQGPQHLQIWGKAWPR